MPDIKTSKGEISAYGFGCGYQETCITNGIQTRMYMEHTTYHVRQYDFDNFKPMSWDTFKSLSEARKFYKKLVKEARDKND
jgi:hypothetical protein